MPRLEFGDAGLDGVVDEVGLLVEVYLARTEHQAPPQRQHDWGRTGIDARTPTELAAELLQDVAQRRAGNFDEAVQRPVQLQDKEDRGGHRAGAHE